ncbi:hypothetical protein PR202_gb26002 [Eleusine coracana subsp. coracana]|uniref:Uncharacterized protein n=1 Tax=Eleusine coracana subsp. coracana TaxID=191504 RepID=A0AAV5FRL7_ELECO|nr:hypothetical protein PR202_gb26002 [Eleusine coracana subsp. coracana]
MELPEPGTTLELRRGRSGCITWKGYTVEERQSQLRSTDTAGRHLCWDGSGVSGRVGARGLTTPLLPPSCTGGREAAASH